MKSAAATTFAFNYQQAFSPCTVPARKPLRVFRFGGCIALVLHSYKPKKAGSFFAYRPFWSLLLSEVVQTFPAQPGHTRDLRRSWLCGRDSYSNKDFEHRKAWLKRRILDLGDIFATGIYAFAVMSNHVHIVLHMHPASANAWSSAEVANRWVQLYPANSLELCAQKAAGIIENPELVATYRSRLADVSWLMKSLSEPIARRANSEDKVTGRFWEGRFKSQLLVSEKSILAAMTYVDLNPIRADIAKGVSTSSYTSVKMRHDQILKNEANALQTLAPLAGVKSFNVPPMTEAEYIDLVDFTGRELHPGKRGVIKIDEPKALRRLGLDKDHWTMKVKGVGSSYWRVVGSLEELIEKAKELKQRTLFGIGFARFLKNI